MSIKGFLCASTLAVAVATCASAGQTTLNFDDIVVSGGNDPMPTNYGGFAWDTTWVVTQDFYQALYTNTVTFPSPSNAFYNGPGAISETITRATPFEFVSLQAAFWGSHDAAYVNSSASLTVQGYRNGVLVGSDSLTLGIKFATLASSFASTPIDTLVLLNDGVEPHWWLADNLTYDGVPEPSTWATILLGFAGLGVARRRANRRKAALVA